MNNLPKFIHQQDLLNRLSQLKEENKLKGKEIRTQLKAQENILNLIKSNKKRPAYRNTTIDELEVRLQANKLKIREEQLKYKKERRLVKEAEQVEKLIDEVVNNRDSEFIDEIRDDLESYLMKLIKEDKIIKFESKVDNLVTSQVVKNINNIKNLMNYIDNPLKEVQEQVTGSDPQYISKFVLATDRKVEIIPKPKRSKAGGYFPYLNMTKFDLTRYQIVSDIRCKQLLDKNCLLYALELLGYDTEDLKILVKNHVAKKSLKHIAIKLDITFNLTEWINVRVKTEKIGCGKNLVKLALYQDHYFLYEPLSITYSQVKDVKNGNKKYNSLTLIKDLYELKQLVLDARLFNGNGSYNINDIISLKHIETEQALFGTIKPLSDSYWNKDKIGEPKVKGDTPKTIYFAADTECHTQVKHKPYIYAIGYMHHNFENDKVNTSSEITVESSLQDLITNLSLKYSKKKTGVQSKFVIYFHNLKYDWNVACSNLEGISMREPIEKGGQLYEVKLKYFDQCIVLRDSCKLIASPLKGFSKMFGFEETKQEYILYDLPTATNIRTLTVPVIKSHGIPTYYLSKNGLTKKIPKDQKPIDMLVFDNRVTVEIGILDIFMNLRLDDGKPVIYKTRSGEMRYRQLKHMAEYCISDVSILRQGLMEFRRLKLELLGLDSFDYLTISSLVHEAVKKTGIYDETMEVQGLLQSFIAKSCMGGRVCTKDNKIHHVKVGVNGVLRIDDLDAKSLYPTAIEEYTRIHGGYPKGTIKTLKQDMIDDNSFRKTDHYIVRCICLTDSKYQQIPFTVIHTDTEIKYTNKMKGEEVIIDKITFEDWEEFCDMKFKIIEGIYWNEGFSNGGVYNKFLNNMYDKRSQTKGAMNIMIKLCLNAQYGKTITKRPLTKRKVVSYNYKKHMKYQASLVNSLEKVDTTKERYLKDINDQFISNNYNHICEDALQLGDNTIYKLEDTGYDHFNSNFIGGLILSTSKRIMHRVMSLANELGIEIIYTDTDSMHIITRNNKSITELQEAYKNKYPHLLPLLGGKMGQFAIDFEIPDCNKNTVHSVEGYFNGKKVYIDILRGINSKGEVVYSQHARMKGINNHALSEYIKYDEEYGIETLRDVYKRIYEHEEITFNLLYGDGISFNVQSNNFVESRLEMTRKIKV
jgi:hypothetical protein